MLTTEEEAKTKRCHEGFAASPGATKVPETEYAVRSQAMMVGSIGAAGYAAAAQSTEPKTAPIFCLGSACMAWRWVDDQPLHHPECKGYCGKAGKP